jgi:hypothetical protein
MTTRFALLIALSLTVGCDASVPASDMPAESDAGAVLEPERNIVLAVDGALIQVTDLPGAEELEVLSPDGAWVAFVAGGTGIASVWAVPMPTAATPKPMPIQLTNVGLESVKRVPGQPPAGFVPVPETAKGLRWLDQRTVGWSAAGKDYAVEVPR